MPYKNGKRKTWVVSVPTKVGSFVRRSTGTTHRATAVRIEHMLVDLGPRGRRMFDLVDAVLENQLTLGALLDAWDSNDLDGLRNRLKDVNLEPYVNRFLEHHTHYVKSVSTIANYRHILRRMFPEGKPFGLSRFSVVELDRFISTYRKRGACKRPKAGVVAEVASKPTRRKVHAALSQFAKYLIQQGVLTTSPLDSIKALPPGESRMKSLEVPQLLQLVESLPEPHRTLAALLAGTGIELSVALALRKSDVNIETRQIRARGTKNHNRNRVATATTWAWPFIAARLQGMSPNGLLFDGIPGVGDNPKYARNAAYKVHVNACAKLGIADYTMHDHRHSYAVRALRAGTPAELVARQLGHANPAMVMKVYGRFVPNIQDVARWETAAAKQDLEAIAAAEQRDLAESPTAVQSRECNDPATNPATKLSVVRGGQYAKRRANPKAGTALVATGAGGLEPPTSALTVRRSAD